jgi:hypothetical protein
VGRVLPDEFPTGVEWDFFAVAQDGRDVIGA